MAAGERDEVDGRISFANPSRFKPAFSRVTEAGVRRGAEKSELGGEHQYVR